MNFDRLTRYLDNLPNMLMPGCDLAVWIDHEPVYRHFTGERAPGVPMDGTELFWLYSATKVFTMTAAMQLVEKGVLSLNTPVADVLPAWKRAKVLDNGLLRSPKTVMTLEHLMAMQGGLDYDNATPLTLGFLAEHPNATTREYIDLLAEKPLNFDPGTSFTYSMCHDVVAAMVEAASGERFSEYLKNHLFAPLGIRSMGFHPDDETKKRFALRWRYCNGDYIEPDGYENHYKFTPNYESGGAGLYGSVDDYILLCDALANGGVGRSGERILTAASIDNMRANRQTGAIWTDFHKNVDHKPGYGYGLGVRTLVDPGAADSRSPVGEFGWDGAAAAWTMSDPERHIAAFFATHVMGYARAYHVIHPAIRNLIYEGVSHA